MTAKKIFVIAGEASGDLHGSHLIQQLRTLAKTPPVIYGVGGDCIRQTGALEFLDLAHFHVTGLTDALRRLPQYQRAAAEVLSKIEKTRPDLVVLIDNPGFNLHLAKKIHALKIPIFYYIAPQVWAWAPKRILKIKKYMKKVLVVFQFEEKIYEDHGIPVSWVGHPLKDLITAGNHSKTASTDKPRDGYLISLLPGSRKGELKKLFAIFLKTARLLSGTLQGVSFALIKSPTVPAGFYQRFLQNENLRINLIEKDSYEVIRSSDLAIVCSGTATLECALLGTPMIISNKASLITYLMAKTLIRVPCLGLPNLVLGKNKIPELLQYAATPEKIAEQALRILTNDSIRQEMKKDLEEVSRRLGNSGASKRAALEVLKTLSEN